MSDITCTKQSDHLLTTSTTYVAGYRCESVGLYWGTCVLAILLQIGSNYIYVKSSQATREALHEKNGERTKYVWKLVGFTLISMAIYIANILLILGANIGILVSVLIGNVAGTVISVISEKSDKARTAIELVTMIKEFEDLKTRVSGDACKGLNCDEKEHLDMIHKAQDSLRKFINAPVVTGVDESAPDAEFSTAIETFSF